MGKTRAELKHLEETRGVQLGHALQQAIADGICPECGDPITGTRRAGDDHQRFPVGALVFVPCGHQFGCGHINRY